MVVAARGGTPRSLSAATDRPVAGWPFSLGQAISWAPGSRSVYFLAADRGTVAIYRAGLRGDAHKVLEGERQIESFVLTPDGKRAVFAAVWPNRPWELYSAALANGRRETNLSHANDGFLARVELGDECEPHRSELLGRGGARALEGTQRAPDAFTAPLLLLG